MKTEHRLTRAEDCEPFIGAEVVERILRKAGALRRPAANLFEMKTTSADQIRDTRSRSENVRQRSRGAKWADYVPLMVIVALTLLSTVALLEVLGMATMAGTMLAVAR